MKRLLALFFAISLPSFAAELHEVRMHRPHKAGEKFSASITASVDFAMTYSINNRVAREQKVDASCVVEGEIEILAVDKKGRVSSAKIKVTKADGKVDGSAAQIFKPGDVISARRNQKGSEDVEVNGEKPGEAQLELARMIVPTSRESKVTDDDVFGPGRSVASGEEWSINNKAAVEEFSELGRLAPENIKGTVKIAGVEETDGQKCLRLRGQLSIKGKGFGVPDAPDWMKVRSMEIDADLDSSVPADASAVIPRTKMAMIMDIAASGETEQEGQTVKVALSMHRKQTSEQHFKPVK